jgi:hypothetical protein
VKAKKAMSRTDFAIWDFARKNSDKGKIDELVRKYGLREEYEAHRVTLNRIRDEANHVGMDVEFIKDYAPRVIKDPEGFLKATVGSELGRENGGVISKTLEARAKKLGLSDPNEMTPEMKADVVSNVLFGGFSGFVKPGNTKERTIKFIPPHLDQYYMDSDAALMHYLHNMRKHIEIRNFFGKIPKVIAGAKAAMHQGQSRLRNALKEEEEAYIIDHPFHRMGEPFPESERVAGIKETIAEYRSILDKY